MRHLVRAGDQPGGAGAGPKQAETADPEPTWTRQSPRRSFKAALISMISGCRLITGGSRSFDHLGSARGPGTGRTCSSRGSLTRPYGPRRTSYTPPRSTPEGVPDDDDQWTGRSTRGRSPPRGQGRGRCPPTERTGVGSDRRRHFPQQGNRRAAQRRAKASRCRRISTAAAEARFHRDHLLDR